jgi:uncharacterized protein
MSKWSLGLVIGIALIATYGSSDAQSFNCRTARAVDEVAICRSAALSGLDGQMSGLYFQLRNSLTGGQRVRLQNEQAVWLRTRRLCGGDPLCLENTYTLRIGQLSTYAGSGSGQGADAQSSIFGTLPAEVQKDIEAIRAACREGPNERNTSGDEGLRTFTVAGAPAVLVDELNFCAGGECIHGVNCATGYTHNVAIYVRSGTTWRKALSTFASEPIFLSVDYGTETFRLMVLHVFSGDWGCPDRGNSRGKCPAIVRWNGSKFTVSLL